MRPIAALFIVFFAINLWHFTHKPSQNPYFLLYHVQEKTFGCDSYDLTAHLLFLQETSPAHFIHSLNENLSQKHCETVLPNQIWAKKEHYYHMTLLHPVSWRHDKDDDGKYIILSTSSLAQPESFLKRETLPYDFWLIMAGLIFLSSCIYDLYKRRKAWEFILEHITYHREKLAQKRLQRVHYDTYGVAHYEKWYQEISFFCKNYLLPHLKKKNLHHAWPKLEKKTRYLIHEWASLTANSQRLFPPPSAEKEKQKHPQNLHFSKNMHPLDYEKLCAQFLEHAGWETYLTPASSDQGADIIAIRNGVRLVVQCKLYSRPVGNRAVQEIFTAKEHQKAHIAAVASNAHYTRQAYQLAASTGVYLLHHKQLTRFTEKTPLMHPIHRA